jgi:hypothetical protein
VFNVDMAGHRHWLSMSLADRLTDDPWALLDRIDGIQEMFLENFEGWGGKPLSVRAQVVPYVVEYDGDREHLVTDAVPVLGYSPRMEGPGHRPRTRRGGAAGLRRGRDAWSGAGSADAPTQRLIRQIFPAAPSVADSVAVRYQCAAAVGSRRGESGRCWRRQRWQ